MVARGDRALHDRDAVRGLPRLPPQARGAGGQDRRPAHRRGQPALGQRRDRLGAGLAGKARRQAQRDRPSHPEGDRRPAGLPARRRARLSDAVARLRHAVGRREPAHPPRLADRLGPDRRALCAGRAVDRPAPARQRAAARHAAPPARPRQHGDRGRARRGGDPRRRLCRRRRPRRRRPRRRDRRQGNAGRDRRQSQFADRPVPVGRADGRDPRQAPRGAAGQGVADRRGARQQPQGRDGDDPARALHLRHRRLRRRQVDAHHRHALQGRGAPSQRRQRSAGAARAHRRPGGDRQGDRHRPVADRPHAALQSGHLHRRLHPHPRLVRRPAGGQGARLSAGAVLVQRQGRALRGLPGRRRDQDRDALPARRLRHLRRLQGQALRPRDAGGALQATSRSPTCST